MWGCGPGENNDDGNDKDGHLIVTIMTMMANIISWKHRDELWIICLCMHSALSVDDRPIQRLT